MVTKSLKMTNIGWIEETSMLTATDISWYFHDNFLNNSYANVKNGFRWLRNGDEITEDDKDWVVRGNTLTANDISWRFHGDVITCEAKNTIGSTSAEHRLNILCKF